MTVALTQLIIDWIASLGWDDRQELGYPLVPGPYVPPSPDRLVIITGTGGPGFLTEETSIDGSNYQVRLRGAPNDPLAVEAAASQLDLMMVRAPFPAYVDGQVISVVNRIGSGPTALPWDATDERVEFTSSYTIVVGV
jgi:hypothetical protein